MHRCASSTPAASTTSQSTFLQGRGVQCSLSLLQGDACRYCKCCCAGPAAVLLLLLVCQALQFCAQLQQMCGQRYCASLVLQSCGRLCKQAAGEHADLSPVSWCRHHSSFACSCILYSQLCTGCKSNIVHSSSYGRRHNADLAMTDAAQHMMHATHVPLLLMQDPLNIPPEAHS
jgi:hypothetical protein